MPVRVGISSRVYQVDVMNISPGKTVAYATPGRKRTVTKPPKLEHAAMRTTTAPKKKVLYERHLPTDKRAINRASRAIESKGIMHQSICRKMLLASSFPITWGASALLYAQAPLKPVV
ncbi:hypothetical protein DL766_005454 [Monosporascus sp. MC13-8B]|uniref:Uncharacterized protein n=1 Tax=Monosporascus cannonballus TaxID=155416 RepID=A0ABY0HCJ8_9PEZI|nr:hypothetical protein DL762_004239 [Monosporascus cannonballus]RYP00627.1 hypothetical protein DL763_000681 [Monosporascus cannonballus]RYP29305.1 hypothetical protein DL766_005454 [Monosporascus sp. MC13-8B]